MKAACHMSIAIVTHCYCQPETDVYAQMLKHQFASLVHYSNRTEVTLWVCCTREDMATAEMIKHLQRQTTNHVSLQVMQLPPPMLFRRSIGRNKVAQEATQDIIWFTDVDYLFGPNCLDSVCHTVGWADSEWKQKYGGQKLRPFEMYKPGKYFISYDNIGVYDATHKRPHHAIGDKYIELGRTVVMPHVVREFFAETRARKAIGGQQIVTYDTVQQLGYLNDSKEWQTPVDASLGFRSCRCDTRYRRRFKSIKELPIQNLFRLRHSSDGRDYDLAGDFVGKEAWK